MVDARGARLLGAAGAEGALWAMSSDATKEMGARLLETHRTHIHAEAIWKSYANSGEGSRGGFVFEAMQAHSYNINAAERGSEFRAVLAGMVDGKLPPADIHINSHTGVTWDSVQAKLYGAPGATADALAQDKYLGMQRLVASDKMDAVDEVLDKRVEQYEGTVRYEAYEDTRANLTDRIRFGGVESDPMTRDEVLAAGNSLPRWADDQLRSEEWRKVQGDALHGAALGAGMGAAVGTIIEGVRQTAAVRSGEVSVARAVITSVGSGVKGGVRGGLIGGIGAGLQSAARRGLEDGVAFDWMPKKLANGAAPFAVAKCIVDVGEAAFDLARGTIDATTFAVRSAESLTTTAIVYACSTAGQTLIPVPGLGAVAGGLAGQLAATLFINGVRMGIAALRAAGDAEEARIAALEAEVLVALEVESALQDALRAMAEEFGAAMRDFVLPMLDSVEASLLEEDADAAVARLTQLTLAFGGTPVFTGVAEFDALMAGDQPLVLRPTKGAAQQAD